jgi:hypothetical protein
MMSMPTNDLFFISLHRFTKGTLYVRISQIF